MPAHAPRHACGSHLGKSGKPYVGRFAPTPSGPLHAGSLVAALGSWLDARAHGGRWLLRIEDVDAPRTMADAAQTIQHQLSDLGLKHDGDVLHQSTRDDAYRAALDALVSRAEAYPCGCSRQAIDARLRALGSTVRPGEERIYPGTCRNGRHGLAATAWRFRLPDVPADTRVHWTDRRLGDQEQDVRDAVGDFVLKRADGPWAYQLAVVVDDAAQGITHVVRGEDLLDNTARQMVLQRSLGCPIPAYLHLPLVRDDVGAKLSKTNGAEPLVMTRGVDAVAHLQRAGRVLGLTDVAGKTTANWLDNATIAWRQRYARPF